jgi:enoyl-CoA hydratase/carnithine racemase
VTAKEETMTDILTLRQPAPGYWRVTIDNPPLNLFDPDLLTALQQLVGRLEADNDTKVVVFDSANPDYFIAHIDLIRADQFDQTPQPSTGLVAWPDLAARLERAPFVTVSAIRGRTRGVGSEFALATDVRFASRERALFCHPELGFGFIPGGGGLERLSLNTGRARAIEIIIGACDFDADTAERYGWINRAIADAELDTFVDAWATRVAQFDRDAITAAKHTLNAHGGLPDIAWFAPSQQTFYQLLAQPHVQARMREFLDRGMQQPGDFELNLADQLTQTPAPTMLS